MEDLRAGDEQDRPSPVLPPSVRARVVALAADCLASLPAEEVPSVLRAVARFTPAKRARLGATQLAAALERDEGFRAAVSARARAALPELAAAVAEGNAPAAAPPEDVAALAWLFRATHWQERVAAAAAEGDQRVRALAGTAQVDAVQRLTEQLEAVRATSRQELAQARVQAQAHAIEVAALRRKVRELGDRVGRAEQTQRTAEAALALVVEARDEVAVAHEMQSRKLRDQLKEAEAVVAQARQAGREGRQDDQLRLRLLLDALVGAAQGLRRELALPPAEGRPADALVADYAVPAALQAVQGRTEEDPALLDALLAVPATHLLVDGYNVTKTAYGALPLETQRGRLLSGLAALAARTAAEVTVVFDGAERPGPLAPAAPRGVRLLFSRPGETADEVLRRLARNEPPGRPVVVVSSDREVADGVRDVGGRAVAAVALVRLLERSVGRAP